MPTGAGTLFGVAVAMLLLWLGLMLVVSLVLPIFAPSPFYGFSEFASVAAVLTLPIAVGILVGYRWVTRVPEAGPWCVGRSTRLSRR